MPVSIVHFLEKVDIGNGHAELGFGIILHKPRHLLIDGAAVRQLGQCIRLCLMLQFLVVNQKLAFRFLNIGAEHDAVHGSHQKQEQGTDRLEQHHRVLFHGDNRFMRQGIVEQQHPEHNQDTEVNHLD